jgi:hypothetical protein
MSLSTVCELTVWLQILNSKGYERMQSPLILTFCTNCCLEKLVKTTTPLNDGIVWENRIRVILNTKQEG